MMNTVKSVLVGLVLGSALPSAQAVAEGCTAPDSPTLPDGSTATLEQMLDGQAAVKAYQASNTEYRSCLEPLIGAAETAASAEEPTQEQIDALKALNEQYNASVSAEEDLAGKFNTELKAYKAANPG
jgi:hypothetical protein